MESMLPLEQVARKEPGRSPEGGWLTSHVPAGRLEDRDPGFIRAVLPAAELVADLWFRAEVNGLDNIPAAGPVLLVGNHSGGNMTPDTMVFVVAFCRRFGVERPFYQLAHSLVMAQPLLQPLRKFGMMLAVESNARAALDRGAALLVYPGGDVEVHRPSWHSRQVDFAGRCGFIRLAMERRVPLVPVVSIGGQETALFLTGGQSVARALHLDRLLRLKVLPVSLAAPWGLNLGDFLGHVPLPSKLTVEVLPAIDLTGSPHSDVDVARAYRYVTSVMQSTLDSLAEQRRFPLVG